MMSMKLKKNHDKQKKNENRNCDLNCRKQFIIQNKKQCNDENFTS